MWAALFDRLLRPALIVKQRPDISAPRWDVKIYDEDAISPGYWFVAPYAHLKQSSYKKWNGPHIYDGNGELVWSGAPMFKHYNTYDFRTVDVGGEQMASLIFRKDEDGVIFDSNYQVHKTVDMVGEMPQWLLNALGDERKTNMHDFNVIANGTRALVLTKVFENATIEESHAIGFEGNCTAKWQGFKELDLATSKPVFEWSAHGHIGLEESTFRKGSLEKMCNGNLGKGGWDILHLNSIDKFPDGDYLVSSRHTDALYKVSHLNGSIVWRLGGTKSDFTFADDANFSRQHHARLFSQNGTHTLISVFDNARGTGRKEHPSSSQSRGLILSLRTDLRPMTAEVVAKYDRPQGGYTSARGSVQVLPNDNAFVCWSKSTFQSEHAPDGRKILEAKFKLKAANSYRSYKFPWVGRPLTLPDVHSAAIDVGPNGTSTLVHVSWNGATEVASWRLYKTNADGSEPEFIASTMRQGFETALSHDGYASFVMVEALDADAKVIGRSGIMKTIPPSDLMSPSVVEESQWLQHHSMTQTNNASKLLSALSHPIFVFIFGVLCCALTGLALWFAWSSKRTNTLWWARRPEYEPLPERDQEKAELDEDTLVEDEGDENEKSRVPAIQLHRCSQDSESSMC